MLIDDIEIKDGNIVSEGRLNVIVRSRNGLQCLNRYSPIGRSMMFYGEHAQNELNYCVQFIELGAVVLDVGAHQGTHTIVFSAKVGPTGRVFAFEPQRLMYQNTCASLALNSIENVSAFNVAVGNSPGKVRIVEFDYSKRAHFSGMRIAPENSGEEVPLITLDDAIPPEVTENISFIKIDVEGMELAVLEGAGSIVSKSLPTIYCEYHEETTGKAPKNVITFLKRRTIVFLGTIQRDIIPGTFSAM